MQSVCRVLPPKSFEDFKCLGQGYSSPTLPDNPNCPGAHVLMISGEIPEVDVFVPWSRWKHMDLTERKSTLVCQWGSWLRPALLVSSQLSLSLSLPPIPTLLPGPRLPSSSQPHSWECLLAFTPTAQRRLNLCTQTLLWLAWLSLESHSPVHKRVEHWTQTWTQSLIKDLELWPFNSGEISCSFKSGGLTLLESILGV